MIRSLKILILVIGISQTLIAQELQWPIVGLRERNEINNFQGWPEKGILEKTLLTVGKKKFKSFESYSGSNEH